MLVYSADLVKGQSIELRSETLPVLHRRGLGVPSYERAALVPHIVHIGVGNFHRAHLAVYVHHLAERGSRWGIIGVGLLPGDRAMADALTSQDNLYTFSTRSSTSYESAVIGSIVDYVFAADDHQPAIECIAHADTRILSMTVTESGYDASERNRATFDVIAAGLRRRREASLDGLTILSCDNLPGNGDAARRCVVSAAEVIDAGLVAWIERNCSFPNSMVDRITPATTGADRAHLVDTFGMVDRCPVVAEPFQQWVVEDNFVAGRPDFASVGALYSDDVRAWELYKLRLLNAGHSAIAYLSALAGIVHVDEAMATDQVRCFLERFLLDEACPTLTPIAGHPAEDYVATVLERFANTGVRDQIHRLCIDGTSKFPTFLMPTVERQLELGGPITHAAHALAGWAHYLADTPIDEQAHDSLGHLSRPLAQTARSRPTAFLHPQAGFPESVAGDPRFVEEFGHAHRSIGELGTIGALERLARS